jgi:hypothetical protein
MMAIKDILSNVLKAIFTSSPKISVTPDKGKIEDFKVTETIKFDT